MYLFIKIQSTAKKVVTHSHHIVSLLHLAKCVSITLYICYDMLCLFSAIGWDPLIETKEIVTHCLDWSKTTNKTPKNSTHISLTKKFEFFIFGMFASAAVFCLCSSFKAAVVPQKPRSLATSDLSRSASLARLHSRCFYPRRTLCSGLAAWKSCLQWTGLPL